METTTTLTSKCNSITPQEMAKFEMKRINQYDYDKMLEEFKFEESLTKLKKKRIQKIKTDNALYKQSVNKMRQKTQEAEVRRIKAIKESIDEKNAGVESNKYQKNKEKEEKMLKTKNDRLHMEQTAKSNVEDHQAILEERRLEEAERTMDRLREFQEKHNELTLERKTTYSKKLRENVDKYNQHYLIQIEREAVLTQTREEEKFKKYSDNFWKQKERMNRLKKKKENHQMHLNKIREIKEQREIDMKKKRNRTIQKIEKMITKRKHLELEKHRRCEQAIIEEENKKREVNHRLVRLKRDENEFREAVLLYQQDLIWRGLDKDNASSLKRSTAQ